MLADLGLLGILLWIGVLLIAFPNLVYARSKASIAGDWRVALLIWAVTFSFLLQAVPYGFYQPSQQDKFFWLILGMTVVVRRLSEGRDKARSAYGHRPPATPLARAGELAYSGPRRPSTLC